MAARDEFGLKGFRFHDLRHQHVSILLRTLALPEVAARAGHANPSVTARIYAHVLDDAYQRGADAVAAMLAKRLASAGLILTGTNWVHFQSRVKLAAPKPLK
jgi:integrase